MAFALLSADGGRGSPKWTVTREKGLGKKKRSQLLMVQVRVRFHLKGDDMGTGHAGDLNYAWFSNTQWTAGAV